jgi:hypothetical protein
MQMIFPTPTTATIGHTARPNAAGTHFERARHRCRAGCSRDLGNLEQAETKADCFRSRQGAQIRWQYVAVRANCFAPAR